MNIVQVLAIDPLHNETLTKNYENYLEKMCHDLASGVIPALSGPLPPSIQDLAVLGSRCNEALLFHGAHPEALLGICANGFQPLRAGMPKLDK